MQCLRIEVNHKKNPAFIPTINEGVYEMSSEILNQFLKENLEDLKEKGLYNVIDPLEGPNGPIINFRQRVN